MIVELIPGSFMFTTMSKFKQIGYFYQHTFLYAEEMFIASKVKQLGLKNYVILDLCYIHAQNSPTISKSHNIIHKYRFLFEGILEYTRLNRKFGKIKTLILRLLMVIALWEKYIYFQLLKIRNDK